MAQTVITKAFTEWKAQQAIDNQPVNLDEFIFAYIPDLDVTRPVENTEGLPPADKIVHRQEVSKSGVVNADSVVYSVTLGADVGDFNFNWIGLANKATGTLAMIIHAPTQSKIKNASGQQGNVLVRSMLMEYSGAESATNITTPAETWQIDFTARLAAMDERQRLENIDLYGAAAFFGAGYLVSKNGSQYFVTQGAGYVAGLRSVLAANQNITVSTKPVKVWLDVAWSGTLTSEWKVQSKITVAASLADYAENGVQHHVFALASIDASGNITDLRPKGTLDEQAASDALAKHEKSRNHPDATTSEKGFTQLSSETGSDSESKAATPKAVKVVNDDLQKVKKALGTAAAADVVTSDTDTTPKRLPTVGWMGFGAVSGVIFTDANTPNFNCAFRMGAEGIHGPIAGTPSNIFQFQYDANSGQQIGFRAGGAANAPMYHRSKTGAVWGGWIQVFDKLHPPTAADTGAVSKTGDTMTGQLIMNVDGEAIRLKPKTAGYASYILSVDSANANHWYVGAGSNNNADTVFNNYKGGNNSVILKADGSVTINPTQGKSVIANGPVQIGGIGNAILNIGDNDSGLRSSVDGQVDLWSNSARVGFWNKTTFSFTGQIIPTNYSNFDARFIIADSASYAGFASNDAARPYMRHKASNAVVELARKGDAYTKTESDGRYGVMNGFRRGGQQLRNPTDAWFGNWESPAGCVVTGITMDGRSDGRKLGVYYRQMQYFNKLTNSWINVGD
ncbi:phage tail protein [Enterobacter kobei]|uniref:phage tail-collar fiber domain-containing protein n=1 Tax=Enterobacter kobei TaxID=208224 RepID=UPI0013D34C2D|nr:phage tail protein [Enterobacter kobei]ELE9721258.1 phage tail protein [Enterobacter kobei]